MPTIVPETLSRSVGTSGQPRKLRIALTGSRGIPHTYSGYEVFVRELAPRLAARGHEVIVYCRRSLFKKRPAYYKNVRLIYLPSIETKVLGTPTHTLASMIDLLFRRVDVVLTVNIANAFFCAIPRLFGKRVAINVDGMDWKRDKWGRFGKTYFYWNAKCVGKICPRGVITDAYEMRRIYLEEFRTPSACIPYGNDAEYSSHSEIVRRYGLQPFEYYLVLSRMVPENNADLIVKAFEQTRTRRILAIAGDANYKSEFAKRVKATRDPRVRFLGHIGNAEHVTELHCHSMGGTNPSLLKALGCGNCILALRTPFNEEVLQDYGIFFERDTHELAARLQFLDDNPQMAEHYRCQAPERIRQAYTWEKITDQYEELFLQLAAGKNPVFCHSSVLHAGTEDSRRVLPAETVLTRP